MPGDTVTTQHVKSKSDEAAVKAGCYWSQEHAERVRTFFAKWLKPSKGLKAGASFELLPWQWEGVIAPLFGWRRSDGTRRYREAYIEVPKKNGKSTLVAGVGLYLTIADKEQGAEVYIAAADRGQASIIYDEAAAMVAASSSLKSRCMVTPSSKTIGYPKTTSLLKALSAEAYTKEGINASAVLFDELHAQPTRELWDCLRYSGAARLQPLTISITTAGWDRHSICWERHVYAEKVRDGIIEDWEFLPVIYAAGPDDDWTSPDVWRKANPSLGVTIKEEDMARACKEAREQPAAENAFRRYRLNQWTEQATRWLQLEQWDKCGTAFDVTELEGQTCFAGLDLSSTVDLTALVLYFPDSHKALCHFWIPAENARQRELRDRVPYVAWARDNFLTMTPGNVIDYRFIRQHLKEIAARYDVRQIAYDPYNARQLAMQLQEEDGLPVAEFRQGYLSMNEPTKRLHGMILSGQLQHGGNPILRWMATNAVVNSDPAGNIKLDKSRSREKIDGMVALVMAVGASQMQVVNTGAQSVYHNRGIVRL